MMPKLDGMSATRNIRQYDTWTPIISMTSNTTDQDIQQYFMSGMTDVLPKPFNQGSLGSLLERYCAHLVVQRQQQQQLHLLQQNYSLNGSLLGLNNMTPQLTLIEETNGPDDANNNNKGKGKGIEYLPQLQQQQQQFNTNFSAPTTIPNSSAALTSTISSSNGSIIPQLSHSQSLNDQQQQQQWYLYVNQKRRKLQDNNGNNSL